MMRLVAILALLLGAVNADRAFIAGGSVNLSLESGEYDVRASADNHIRVTFSGNVGGAVAEVTTNQAHADVKVKNTPRNNFHAVIELPKTSDIVLRLTAGDLTVRALTGSKDIETTAGDVKIDVGSAADYASVDATVTVGDMNAGPFGDPRGTFLTKTLKWTGKGKYRLHAKLGAGDLSLR